MFRLGEWSVDPATRRLSRGEQEMRLTPKAMAVLAALHAAKGQVLSRSELLDRVWPDVTVGEEVLTHAIAEIRRALDDKAREPQYVETVHKSGYRLLTGAPSATAPAALPLPVGAGDRAPGRDQEPPDIRALRWGTGVVAPRATNKPSIALLPFENDTGDPEQDYFGLGLSQEIITELCREPDLFVIAPTSSFAFGRGGEDAAAVGRELGVRYVFGGSVGDAGDRLRISAWMEDAKTGRQVWSERYDRPATDLSNLLDDIIGAVRSTLITTVGDGDRAPIVRDPPADLDAYRHVLKAFGVVFRMSRADADAALDAGKSALVLDPTYGRAHAAVAYTHLYRAFLGVADDVPDALRQGRDFARRAIEADRTDYLSYGALCGAEVWTGHHDSALLASGRAVALAPGSADMRALNALVLDFIGRPEDALADIELAVRLNPIQPDWYLTVLARAHYLLGRHDEAGCIFERLVATRTDPLPIPSYMLMAANLVAMDRLEAARDLVQRLRAKMPALTFAEVPQFAPFKQPQDRDRFLGHLEAAGLPS